MKITTIWTLPTLTISERISRTVDWAARTAAASLPARVRYWTFIQVGCEAMTSETIVPDAKFMELLKNAKGGPA